MRSLALLIAFFLPLTVGAQALGGLGEVSGAAFTASVSPQYPSPHSTATVSLVPGTVNLTNATLTASVGGKEIYSGSVRPFSVPLGKTGSVTSVKITVTAGGAKYSQTLSTQPQDVVLVAEPVSFVPPLYPGKSSVPLEGQVRIVAVATLTDASGKVADPAGYAYAWTVDGVRKTHASGIGRAALLVDSPLQYRAREVSVSVVSSGGSLVGGSSLSLIASEPTPRIYDSDPLLGIRYDRALIGSYTISDAEVTLYAAPFSLPTTSGTPTIQWFLNGDSAQTGPTITLRPTGSGQGSALLSLTASGGGLATALANLSLTFGAKPGLNLFGL